MGTTEDMLTREYDGCGMCLVGTRRLSRKTDKTSSPQRQAGQDLKATIDNGGHIIAWADDWEVSALPIPLRGLVWSPGCGVRWGRMTAWWVRRLTGSGGTSGIR